MDSDELYTLKNYFWLGRFEAAIEEASSLDITTERQRIDRDVYVNRSYISLGQYAKVISGIPDTAATDLLAVKLLARTLSLSNASTNSTTQKNKDTCAAILMSLNDLIADPNTNPTTCPHLALISALIHLNVTPSNVEQALHFLANAKDGSGSSSSYNNEVMALRIQILLQINRVDLAKKELERMKSKDEDNTLTQLACAWVFLKSGGGETVVQEAIYIYQELIDRCGGSSLSLFVALGACYIKLGAKEHLEEALRVLQKGLKVEGLGVSVKSGSAGFEWGNVKKEREGCVELVANLLVCATRLRKQALVAEFTKKLKEMTLSSTNPSVSGIGAVIAKIEAYKASSGSTKIAA